MSTDRVTTPFTAQSTAQDVLADVDLSGKRFVVTGGASGIGLETVRALALAGGEVTLAVRNVAAGQEAAETILADAAAARLVVAPLDLADPTSIAAFVAAWEGPLDALVANAGIMALPELTLTPQGWELQFATNHLGHFDLAVGLHDALASAHHARIVSVSSVGHINGEIDFDDINFTRRPYDRWVAYGQSKTANILFAVEAAKRWAAEGITANALNPGRIPATALSRHLDVEQQTPAPGIVNSTGVSVKNAQQGAATTVLLAASPLLQGVTGRYFEDCNEAEPYREGIRRGVADFAIDTDKAERLWNLSVRAVEAW